MKHLFPEMVIGLLLALNAQAACESSMHQTPSPTNVQPTPTPDMMENNPSKLEKQIKAFAEGEGDNTILRDFKARPRDSLITSIKRIRDSAKPSDPIRVKIAFLFCRLGYSYSENRAIVIDGFTNPHKYEEFYADDAVGMMASLIREGDKDLLPITFKASKGADGALAEGLSAIFLENVRENLSTFLQKLSSMNVDIRKRVYELVSPAILTAGEFDRVKASLLSVSRKSEEYLVAKEMLLFLESAVKHRA